MTEQSDLLSQEEIDALLESVNAGDREDSSPSEDAGGIRTYDLSSQQRIVRGRLSGLEVINQRFARMTRLNLSQLLKRDVQVTSGSIKDQKYGEYLHSLYVPTSLNLVRIRPLQGTALVVLDARLVFRLVDHFFGGSGLPTKVEGRDFTAAELRVVELVLERIFADLTGAWKGVATLQCELVGNEVNPAMASIVGAGETVVVNSFQIDIEGGGGELHVVLPHSSLSPLRDALEASVRGSRAESDRQWSAALAKQMMDAQVEIACTVAETEMSLGQLSRLKAGDVIPVDTRQASMMTVNGVPLFQAKLGVAHGNMALKVLSDSRQRLERDDDFSGDE